MTNRAYRRAFCARRRQQRKRVLARRYGWACAYCHRPLPNLAAATLDHVVPLSVYRTWETQFLVLACRPCNDAKADSFPLLIAAQLAPGRIAPALWLLLARLSEAALPAEFEVAA